VGGIIQKRQFIEGSDVQVGQSLYQIDPATYQASYNSAQADVAKAQADAENKRLTVRRYQPLLATHFVSQQDYDAAVSASKQADAGVLTAQAALETARINLVYTKVRAPISGNIGKSSSTEGALVTDSQATALATIQQLDPIYVDVTQSSVDFLRLKEEMTQGALKKEGGAASLELIMEDGSPYDLRGSLAFSDVTVDETTGSITLRAIFPNPDKNLLPGMFVRARLNEGIRHNAILVPQRGITRNARGEAIAWIVNQENVVEIRSVNVGQAIGDKWLVNSGLKEGDRVIITGLQKVKPEMKVKAQESNSGRVSIATPPDGNNKP
jgi:membrane fusion protein (multidrug efflux system)